VVATQNPIEMEGTYTLSEARLRRVPAQAARELSSDQGAERKHFQFQQGPIFLSRIQFTP